MFAEIWAMSMDPIVDDIDSVTISCITIIERTKGLFMLNQQNRIQFEKPDIERLNRAYTVVDLHFHSHYSDGSNSIHEIATYAETLNIGVSITDHNNIRGALEIDTYKDIFSIPGIEVTSCEGTHILIYFYDLIILFNKSFICISDFIE